MQKNQIKGNEREMEMKKVKITVIMMAVIIMSCFSGCNSEPLVDLTKETIWKEVDIATYGYSIEDKYFDVGKFGSYSEKKVDYDKKKSILGPETVTYTIDYEIKFEIYPKKEYKDCYFEDVEIEMFYKLKNKFHTSETKSVIVKLDEHGVANAVFEDTYQFSTFLGQGRTRVLDVERSWEDYKVLSGKIYKRKPLF